LSYVQERGEDQAEERDEESRRHGLAGFGSVYGFGGVSGFGGLAGFGGLRP
jgi:hypothetical protein